MLEAMELRIYIYIYDINMSKTIHWFEMKSSVHMILHRT